MPRGYSYAPGETHRWCKLGGSLRLVHPDYQPKPGETLYDSEPDCAALFPERALHAQLQSLEREITSQRLRDAILSPEGLSWLEAQDQAIAELRASLAAILPPQAGPANGLA